MQEFLAFCLDGLHEDLNLAVAERLGETEDEDEDGVAHEEYVAAVSWMRHLERGKSFLVDLFQGQLRSSLVCGVCGCRSRRFEPFLHLSMPVAKRGMSKVTDALEQFLREEMLVGDEQWFCPKCKVKVDAMMKIDLWKLPPILLMHLKRFEFDMATQTFDNLKCVLDAPLTLDLSSFVSSPQREHATYDVVAVADHHGEFGSGHYTASCCLRTSVGRSWLRFSDAAVTEVSPAEVISKNAYVIFLVRSAGRGQEVKRQTVSLPEVWPHWVSRDSAASQAAELRRDLLDLVPGRQPRASREACEAERAAAPAPPEGSQGAPAGQGGDF